MRRSSSDVALLQSPVYGGLLRTAPNSLHALGPALITKSHRSGLRVLSSERELASEQEMMLNDFARCP
jgi:hypothetical protein